jgi:hypothetical protein
MVRQPVKAMSRIGNLDDGRHAAALPFGVGLYVSGAVFCGGWKPHFAGSLHPARSLVLFAAHHDQI